MYHLSNIIIERDEHDNCLIEILKLTNSSLFEYNEDRFSCTV
jgi:hypothetical protein